MPQFKLNLVLYDKEDYEDLDKMNGIQVNIYLILCKIQYSKRSREKYIRISFLFYFTLEED